MGTGGRLVRGSRAKTSLVGLPRRRYSVPEAVMRRYNLKKQGVDSSSNSNSDSGAATVPALSPDLLNSAKDGRTSSPSQLTRQQGGRGGGRGGGHDGMRNKPMDRGPPMYKGGRGAGGRRGPHVEDSDRRDQRSNLNTTPDDDSKQGSENSDPQLNVPNTSRNEEHKEGSDLDAEDLLHEDLDCLQCKEFLFGGAENGNTQNGEHSLPIKLSNKSAHSEERVPNVNTLGEVTNFSETVVNGTSKTETLVDKLGDDSPEHDEKPKPKFNEILEESRGIDVSSPKSIKSLGHTGVPLDEISDGNSMIITHAGRKSSPKKEGLNLDSATHEDPSETPEDHQGESPVQASSESPTVITSSLGKVSDRSSLSPPDSDLQTSSSSVPTRQSDSSTQSPETNVYTSSGYSDRTPGNLTTPEEVNSTSDPEKYAESGSCSITPVGTSSSSGRGRTPDQPSLESSIAAGRASSTTLDQPDTDRSTSTQDTTVSVPSDSPAFSELTPALTLPRQHKRNVKMESKMTQCDVTQQPSVRPFETTSSNTVRPGSNRVFQLDKLITVKTIDPPETDQVLGVNTTDTSSSIAVDSNVPNVNDGVTPNKSEVERDNLVKQGTSSFCGTQENSLPLDLGNQSLPKDVEIVRQSKYSTNKPVTKHKNSDAKSITPSDSMLSKPSSEPLTKPTSVTPNKSELDFSPLQSQIESKSVQSEVYSWSNRFDEDEYMKLTHQRQRYWMNRKMMSDITLPATPPKGALSSCIGTGTAYRKTNFDVQLVVPRYSALPRTISMLVNTSSTDCSSLSSDSDCLSLVDSLEDAPMLTPKHVHSPSTADVVRLLPEGSGAKKVQERVNVATPRGKAKAFFVPMEEPQGEKQQRPVKSASQSMPDNLKERLAQRHKQIELSRQKKASSQDSTENANGINKPKGRNIQTRRGPNTKVQTKVAEIRKSPKEKLDHVINKNNNLRKAAPPQKFTSKPKTDIARRVPVSLQKVTSTQNDALLLIEDEVFSKPLVENTTEMEEGVKYHIQLDVGNKEDKSPVSEQSAPTDNDDTTPPTKPHPQKSSIPILQPQTEQQKPHTRAPLNANPFHQATTHKPSYLPVRRRQSPPNKRSANLLGNRFQQRFEVIPEERSGSLESSMEDQGRLVDSTKTTVMKTSVKDGDDLKETNLVKQDTIVLDEEDNDDALKKIQVPSSTSNGVIKRLVRPTRSVRSVKASRPARQLGDEPIKQIHKGRESLAPPTEEEMTALSKGWINFYLLNGGHSSPEHQTDEVSILRLPDEAKSHNCCRNPRQPSKAVKVVGGKSNRIKQYTISSQQPPANTRSSQTALPELKNARSSRRSPRECDSSDSNTITAVLKFPNTRLAPAHSFEGSDSIEFSESSSVTSSESDSERALSPALLPVRWPIRQQQRRLPSHQRSKVYQHRSDYAQMSRQSNESGNGTGWTVTVAGNNTSPPDLEMRLSFPACVRRAPNSQSDSGLGEDNNNNNQQGDNRLRRQQQQQHFLPPATPAQSSQRWTLTVKSAVGPEKPQELLKTERRLFEVLPELNSQQGQSRNAKAIKIFQRARPPATSIGDRETRRRRYVSSAMWPKDEGVVENRLSLHNTTGRISQDARPVTQLLGADSSEVLSVTGSAITPEKKPRVPTMSERDLTRGHTARH